MIARKNKERGASLILFTMVATFVLVPIVGLAIDGAILYWEKARLSASVDAAALATGRALNTSLALTTQLSSIKQVGQNYFLANFQPGHMGTTVTTPTANLVDIDASQTNMIVVTVQATISVPLHFARIFGNSAASVSGTGQARRRDLNVIFAIDRSGSIQQSGSCDDLQRAINDVVANYFIDQRDTLELISFQTTANVDFGPSKTFAVPLPLIVSTMVCDGATNASMALSMAHQAITTLNGPTKLNVVVFFTDGYPTGFYVDNSKSAAVTKGSCPASGIKGIITMPGQSPDESGNTYGIISPTRVAISMSAPVAAATAPGCSFSGDNSYMDTDISKDLAYLPLADHYGNVLNNSYVPVIPNVTYPTDIFTSGHVKADSPASVLYAAFNTADAAGQSIRNDATYKPVIYTIGLGGSINKPFLQRLANDPAYSGYDPTLARGQFVYASDSSQLDAAFRLIASQILSLSK